MEGSGVGGPAAVIDARQYDWSGTIWAFRDRTPFRWSRPSLACGRSEAERSVGQPGCPLHPHPLRLTPHACAVNLPASELTPSPRSVTATQHAPCARDRTWAPGWQGGGTLRERKWGTVGGSAEARWVHGGAPGGARPGMEVSLPVEPACVQAELLSNLAALRLALRLAPLWLTLAPPLLCDVPAPRPPHEASVARRPDAAFVPAPVSSTPR